MLRSQRSILVVSSCNGQEELRGRSLWFANCEAIDNSSIRGAAGSEEMQTFMPFGTVTESAAVLDDVRLNKQRIEAKQIYQVLTGETRAWRHHPAVGMWRDRLSALADYGYLMCREWSSRGGRDDAGLGAWFDERRDPEVSLPEWTGHPDVQLSHRSNLIRKDPEFYRPRFPGVAAGMPYLWPAWDTEAGCWRLFISKAEARRDDWTLPDHLTLDRRSRLVRRVG